jgi:hypothetical protein
MRWLSSAIWVSMSACTPVARGGSTVLLGSAHGHEIAPALDQHRERLSDGVRGLPAGQGLAALTPVESQGTGIDGVGFGARAVGAQEGFDLGGIGAVGRDAQGQEHAQDDVLAATGRLAHGQGPAGERSKTGQQSLMGVVEGQGAPADEVMQGDGALSDIQADGRVAL